MNENFTEAKLAKVALAAAPMGANKPGNKIICGDRRRSKARSSAYEVAAAVCRVRVRWQ